MVIFYTLNFWKKWKTFVGTYIIYEVVDYKKVRETHQKEDKEVYPRIKLVAISVVCYVGFIFSVSRPNYGVLDIYIYSILTLFFSFICILLEN